MGGMDGACDVDNGIDVDTTQSTDYGRFSLPPDSTISGAVQPGIGADYYLIPGDETQPSTPIHEEDMETYRSDGGHVIAPTRYKGPMSSMDEQQYLDLAAAAAKAKNDSTLADHNEMETPPKRPRSPDAGFGYARPTKQKTPENWRVKQIIANGLPHVKLPHSLEALPFDIRWEAARVLQTRQITPEQLEHQWQSPRTMASLHALVDGAKIKMLKGFETDFTDCSLAARLQRSSSNNGSLFELALLRPVKQKRNEFERECGGSRVLVLEYCPPPVPSGLTKDNIREAVKEIMCNDHSLFGRIWSQSFFSREKKRTNKATEPGTMEFHLFATGGDDVQEVPIGKWMDRLLCFRENADQFSGKLYSRLEIKASRTVDGPRLRADQIEIVDDIKPTDIDDDISFHDPAFTFDNVFDEETEKIAMTDGCGTISAYLMRLFMKAKGYDGPMPSGVQGRIAGCKGFFVVCKDETLYNPYAAPPDKLITIRKSQLKINQKLDQQYFTFYILKFSAPSKPSVLHPAFLPIMYDRRVAKDLICNFSVASIHDTVDTFEVAAADPNDHRRWNHEQQELPKMVDRHLGVKMIGGFPASTVEKVDRMLECGFNPAESRYLANEVTEQVAKILSLKAKKYRIPCVNSATVYGMPDFTGTLKPGEVHFKPSTGWDGFNPSSLGQIFKELIGGRNPARRPGDLQRLKLVQKEELSNIVDIVVFSTQGRQPEASKMQGGDYDGDMFWLCWEPSIVMMFLNAPAPREADRRAPSELFLMEDKRKFSDIVTVPEDKDLPLDENEIREWLSINTEKRMQFNFLGMATRLHEKVAYYSGALRSPVLDALNDLCDYLLDAHKQCLSFTREAWDKLRKKLDISELDDPAYMEYTKIDETEHEETTKKRSPPRSDSIIDQVYCVKLQAAAEEAQQRVKKMFPNATLRDEDLTAFFDKKLASLAQGTLREDARQELEQLPTKMLNIAVRYKEVMRAAASAKDMALIIPGKAQVRQQFLDIQPANLGNELVNEWTYKLPMDEISMWEYFKAAALFQICYHTAFAKVPFNVAGRELCWLKAQAVSAKQGIPSQLSTGTSHCRTKPSKLLKSAVFRAQDDRNKTDAGIEAADADEVVGDEGDEGEEAGVDDELLGEDWETADVGIGGASTSPFRQESEALIDLTVSD
jgi:hypothetical protein